MDFVKSQLDRIQQQLAGLNASQRMLAGCLVAIIVMTIAWWGHQAGTSERSTLFGDSLEPADAGVVKQLLVARGIDAQIGADNHLTVPAASANEAMAVVAMSDLAPKGPSVSFESFLKGVNPFLSQSMSDAQLTNFKSARLAEVIREFPGVKAAQVFIDPTRTFGLNGTGVEPSATVHIRAKDARSIGQTLVDGAANLVMGAQAGLSWKRVTVMVNGAPRRVSDPENRGADTPDLLELREKYQNIYADRVLNLLRIPGLSVSVTVGLNDSTVRRRSHTFDKKNSFNLEAESSEKNRESTGGGGGGPAGEPGAQSNVTMAVAGAQPIPMPPSEPTQSESESKTKFNNYASDVTEETMKSAGLSQPTGAAVLVPRSHVVNVLKNGKQNPPEPDDTAIDSWCKKELPKLQEMVRNNVGLASLKDVSIDLYTDLMPIPAPGDLRPAVPAAFSTASIAAAAGGHTREIALGSLALISLFMMLMMVRKAGPVLAPAVLGVQATTPMPILDATEALAGEVSEGKSMLDAMELDEDAVRAQQMVDQVASMVEDNPDAAAGLVKRWMSRT